MQNELLMSFMAHTSDGIVVVDLDGRILEVNGAFEAMHGWKREEVLGKTLPMTPPQLIEQTRKLYADILSGQDGSGYETIRTKKDGSQFQASITISPIKASDGRVIAFVGVERDITAQKTAERKRMESEERYRQLIELSPEPIIVLADYEIVYANPAAIDLFGVAFLEEIGGKYFLQFVHDYYVTEMASHIKHALQKGRPTELFFTRFVRFNKSAIEAEVKIVPILTSGHRYVQLLIRDISQFRRAEESLHAAEGHYKEEMERSLRVNAESYQRLIQFLPEPIVVFDGEMILYANQSAEQLFRVTEGGTLIGRSMLEFVSPEYIEEAEAFVREGTATEHPTEYVERPVICCDGQTIEVEVSGICLQHYFGKTVTLCVFRDLTDRKRAEELLIRSEKLSIAGQLAAGLAHEIRNPLTSLKGFNQLLKTKYKHESSYFDLMLTELDRINMIVEDFMTLAKPKVSQFSTASLRQILEHVASILNHQAVMMSVLLTLDTGESVSEMECDENQLKQLFINLIKNAIEAMPGGGEVVITATLQDARHVSVRITDQGEGIPESLLPKLGEPFITTKTNGTGLGLMISNRIVHNHRGTMNMRKGEFGGTVVEIVLPLRRVD